MQIDKLCKNTTWLAPLAGFTDYPYRMIAKENGANILTTEMVSAAGLAYNPRPSLPYAQTSEDESPIGIQLFGSDPSHFQKAISILPRMDFLCLNMGCPVKKVIKTGAGSALMDTPELASQIVQTCKLALPENTPLVVKFRSGFSKINYLEFGLLMQKSGADALVLHPRTKSQMFAGISNWEHIKILKNETNIPVIGNGDIFTKEDIEKMKNETNCDGVMIGRGAIGNPWIFSNKIPTNQGKIETIKRHYSLSIKYYGETKGIITMRSHIAKYTKGIRNGAEARVKINLSTNLQEIFAILGNLFR